MSITKSLNIRQKIQLLAAVAILGFGLFLYQEIQVQKSTEASITQIQHEYFPALSAAINAKNALKNLDANLQAAVTTGDEEVLELAQDELNTLTQSLTAFSTASPGSTAAIRELEKQLNAYQQGAFAMANELIDGSADFTTLPARAQKSAAILDSLNTSLDTIETQSNQAFNQTITSTIEDANDAVMFGIGLGIATISILIATTFFIQRSIVKSLNTVTTSLRSIVTGEGDLTLRVNYDGKDEIADLVHWFNQFIVKMQKSISDTSATISALQDVSERLKNTSEITTENVHAQSASVTEVSEAIQLMSESVDSIAANASQASGVAEEANNTAIDGSEVVEGAITSINQLAHEVNETSTMVNQLETHTDKAGLIINTIRDIAEQTNLLALNAAIEAARAGEQGRGFAVVADEVRTLASRTQDSTQEIQQVLSAIQDGASQVVVAMDKGTTSADHSVSQSGKSGDSLHLITDKVKSIMDLNQQIAVATEEQSLSSQRISSSIHEIEKISQSVSSSSVELDKVSDDIQTVTRQLGDVIQQYKV